MRKILFLFLLVLVSKVYGQSKSYDYCYTNGKSVFVYSIAAKKSYPILDPRYASDASISPDGTKVAYTIIPPGGGDRAIGLIDLNTKKKTRLNTKGKSCNMPVWSPDGKYIAYNNYDADWNWSIAITDAANTVTKVIITAKDQYFMLAWLPDGKRISVQTLASVLVYDLSGNIVESYNISDMVKGPGPSSSDRFVFTPDKKIVFSSQITGPAVGDNDMPTGIFVYDIQKKSTKRITPKRFSTDGFILKNNKVLFTALTSNTGVPGIYTVDLDGKNLKVLFPDWIWLTGKN